VKPRLSIIVTDTSPAKLGIPATACHVTFLSLSPPAPASIHLILLTNHRPQACHRLVFFITKFFITDNCIDTCGHYEHLRGCTQNFPDWGDSKIHETKQTHGKTAHLHQATCNLAHWLTGHGSPTIYRRFALPQLLYRLWHQSGICRARAMPRPFRSESDFSRPRHSATWARHGMCGSKTSAW
jgi:hypothetical protein